MRKHKRTIIIVASLLAFVILLVTAKAISDSTNKTIPNPTIIAPATAEVTFPATEVKAASDAKLPEEPKPEVKVEAAPDAPINIPVPPAVSTPYVQPYAPFYQPPITQAQTPLSGPEPPLSQPIVPSPVQPILPEITKPVEGLLEPLKPVTDIVTDPLTDILKDTHGILDQGIRPDSLLDGGANLHGDIGVGLGDSTHG